MSTIVKKEGAQNSPLNINFIDIREFAENKHKKVDDYPFGEKKGMLLRADVLTRAIKSIVNYYCYRIIYLCTKWKIFNQQKAFEYQKGKGLIIIPGYYEGIDERLFSVFDIERVSIGDFVLSSGEMPALIMAEAICRLIPGVVGK
mgnify:CR=1 FL=1